MYRPIKREVVFSRTRKPGFASEVEIAQVFPLVETFFDRQYARQPGRLELFDQDLGDPFVVISHAQTSHL